MVNLQSKKDELSKIVDGLDLPTTMILQGVLLEHAMKLVGLQKKPTVLHVDPV